MDIRDLDRRAVAATGAVVAALADDQLDLPTPCAEWVVRDLVAHLVDNNRRLTARLGAAQADPTGDLRADHRATADALARAFAPDDALRAQFPMPLAGGDVSGRTALSVHFADVLVHGWDLARATGADLVIDPELAEAAAGVVARFPAVAWTEDASVFAARKDPDADDAAGRLLALTGRDLGWECPLRTV